MKKNHLHPISIWENMAKFWPFLLLPVLQGYIFKTGVPLTLLICAFIVIIGTIIKYLFQKYNLDFNILYIQKGIIYQRRKNVYLRHCGLWKTETTPILSLLRAVRFIAGNNQKPTAHITVYKQKFGAVWQHLWKKGSNRFTAHTWNSVWACAFFSNPLGGIILAFLMIRKFGKILGEETTQKITSFADQSHRLTALGLPPAVAMVSWLLVAGWLVSFVVLMASLLPCSACHTKKFLLVRQGFWPCKRTVIERKKICALHCEQNLPMKWKKLYRISTQTKLSNGRKSGQILFPALTENEMAYKLSYFFPQFTFLSLLSHPPKYLVKPKKESMISFIITPCLLIIGVFGLYICVWLWAKPWAEVVLFLLLPAAWLLLVRLITYKRTGIAIQESFLILYGCKGFKLYSDIIPLDSVVSVDYTQNPFQKHSGRCHLLVFTTAGHNAKYKIYSLNKCDVKSVIKKITKKKIEP